jgi:acetyl-CoA acetyltransferase
MASLKPSDVEALEIYDPCSFEVIRQLEAFGFCEEGEGGDFVTSGAIEPDGSFPICTDGGTLSHSHTGSSQILQKIVQSVRQVRGDASANQVPGCRVAMTSTGGSGSMFNPVLIVGDDQYAAG